MATFTLQYQLGEVTQVLTMMEARFDDASPFTADALLLMIRSTQLNIEEGGRPTAFAPLAWSTIQRRVGSGENASKQYGQAAVKAQDKYFAAISSVQILRDTGLLMQSLGAGAAGDFATADGFGESDEFSAVLGTNRPGADALQTGYPANNLPAREYVLFQTQDEEDLTRMAEDFFMGTGPYSGP